MLSLLAVSARSLPGVTVWTETGARLDETIADGSTVPPPGVMQPLLAKVPFSNFRYPHVDENENVTFIADDPVYGGEPSRHGIYRSIASSGELQALVRQGETVVPETSITLTWFRGLQMDGATSSSTRPTIGRNAGYIFGRTGCCERLRGAA